MNPILTIHPELSVNFSVSHIIRLAKQYSADLKEFADKMDFFSFYNYVRELPYIPDPKGKETISRPAYTVNPNWKGCRDCDDKTVLIAAFCELKKIPWRVIVCGVREYPHHVYPEIMFQDKWTQADATYPDRCLFGKSLYVERYRKIYDK